MLVLWPRVPGEDKGQQSLLFSLASYPLIEIKKHRLDTMKAKQVSFFWNVIWHMEKKRMFLPKYQQNSRGFAVCIARARVSLGRFKFT